jgi:SAM-dependent methyltransferase|tara:strand:+ start:387 stop:1277 length:891 start_codon:yes stop_codon:yes gene_type:complete
MINIFKKKKKEASRLVGLDIALKVSSFVTGKEHLHYGLWEKLDVTLENLGKAQEAYTNLLFKYLPKKEPQKKLEILDIGGGAGENAKKLIERGHRVTIIVPSKILAEHAKINTNKKAEILITTFEDYIPKYNSFDLCLFAESFQYIPIKTALKKASILLKNNGEILIADCFRSDKKQIGIIRQPGGGASLKSMEKELEIQKFKILVRKEITKLVAPSVELEQKFYNTLGFSINRIVTSLNVNRPITLKFLKIIYKIFFSKRRRKRLEKRLFENTRTADSFIKYNHYMIYKLKPGSK